MTSPSRLDELRQAIAEAAGRLERSAARAASLSGPPRPGHLYVFPSPVVEPPVIASLGPIALEWLVVRAHVDDRNLLVLVPADDFPFAGTADIRVAGERPLTIRCGEGFWAPVGFCRAGYRTESVPDESLRLVRKALAGLARGRVESTEEQRQTDADPAYTDWLDLVAQARQQLQERANEGC